MSVEKFKETILLELGEQRRNAILLIPVFVAMGIGFYFSFLYEPFWWWGGLALVLTVVALFLTRGFGRLIVLSLLCVALGFTAAQIRTHFAYTPMIVEKQDFKDISREIFNHPSFLLIHFFLSTHYSFYMICTKYKLIFVHFYSKTIINGFCTLLL